MSKELPVIIAAFANDRADTVRYLRNLPEETRKLKAALSNVENLCELVVIPNATLDEIFNAFQKYRSRVAIFHYGGHANGFQLLLETSEGHAKAAGAAGLAHFLGRQPGLQLVFLNGCSTEKQTDALLQSGVDSVIATTQSIDDGIATQLSARFYKGLASGATINSSFQEAVAEARAASGGEISRLLIPVDGEVDAIKSDRWPWFLRSREGSKRATEWSLPEAAGDPLFGLPELPLMDLPKQPFRHLHRFRAEDAPIFFGRGHDIRNMYQRITSPDAAPIMLYYGPAGVGKSSLLDAGLIPRLGQNYEVVYIRRDVRLGLTQTLQKALLPEGNSKSPRVSWKAKEKAKGKPLVIILDQVEEAFTKPCPNDRDELAKFAGCLRAIFGDARQRPQGRIILGFRKEWFAEIDEHLANVRLPYERDFIERLDRRGIIEAIRGPADSSRLRKHYRLTIEDGLPEAIADDLLADPNTPVAPTLQILLTRMWIEAVRSSSRNPRFDKSLYHTLQRAGILLDKFLEQQIRLIQKHTPTAVDTGFLLDLLGHHTTPLGTSAENSLDVLKSLYPHQVEDGLLSRTMQLCEQAYLITISGDGDSKENQSARLVHDTLAPLVRAKLEESNYPGQRARRILDNRIADWADGKEGAPLDAIDLQIVEEGQLGTRAWTEDETRLINRSRDIRAKQKHRNRLSAAIVSILTLALIFTVSSVVVYVYKDKEKEVKIGKLEATVDEREGTIGAQLETISEHEGTIAKQKSEITQKDAKYNSIKLTNELNTMEIGKLKSDLRDVEDETNEQRSIAQLARIKKLSAELAASYADFQSRKERLQTLTITQRQGVVLTQLAYAQNEPILAAHHLASRIDNEQKSVLARTEFAKGSQILLETIQQTQAEIALAEDKWKWNTEVQGETTRLKTRLEGIISAHEFELGRNKCADEESDNPDESPQQVARVANAARLRLLNENGQRGIKLSNAQIALAELMTQLQLQAVWRDSPDIRDVVRPHLADDYYVSILQPEAGAENDNLTDVALNSWRAPYTSGPKRFPELLSQNSRTVIGAATNVGDTHLITQFGSRTSSSTLPNLLVVRAKDGEQLEIGSDSTRRQQVLRTSSSNDYVAVIEEEHIELRGPWPRVGSLTATPISTIRPDASSDAAISFTDGAVSNDGKLVAAWGDEYENASLFYPSGFGDEWKSVRLAHLPENPCWHSLLPSNRLIVFNANCEGVLYSPTGRLETRFARPSTMASPPETSHDDSKSFHLCATDLFATKNSGPVLVRYIDIAPLGNSTGQSAPDFREPTIYTWYYDSRDGTSDTTNPQSTRAVDDITGSQYDSIGFTPDGRTVLTAEDGCYIQGSEFPSTNYTKDVLQTLYIPTEGVPNWSVSANGKHLLLWVPPRDSRIGKVVPNQFASRGQVAADSVQIFDTGTGFPLTPAVHLHTKIAGAKFLPNENTSHGTFAVWSCEGEVTVWEFADNPALQQLDEETYRRQNPDAHPNETTTLPEIVKPGLKSADRGRIFEAIESYPQFENVEEVTSVRVCGPMNDSIYDFYAWRGNRLCRVRWHDDTRSIGPLMPISDDSTDRIIDVRAIPFDGGSQKLFILSKSGILTGNIDNAGNLAGELEHIPLPPQNLDAFITENATLVTCNRSSQLSRVQSFVQITELLKLDHASSRVFKHTENVVAARLSADETRLLTLSSFAPDKNSVAPGLLHVWDVETQREIIQPIPVADVSSYAFWFLKGEADQIAMFNIGASGGYILRLLDGSTSPQPEELAEDWRLSVVRKTGTYVDAAGELVYLDAAQWQKAKESKFNTYEDWYEAEVATTETADSLEAE